MVCYMPKDINGVLPATHARIAHSTNDGIDPRLVVTSSEKYCSRKSESNHSANTVSILWEARINKTKRRRKWNCIDINYDTFHAYFLLMNYQISWQFELSVSTHMLNVVFNKHRFSNFNGTRLAFSLKFNLFGTCALNDKELNKIQDQTSEHCHIPF